MEHQFRQAVQDCNMRSLKLSSKWLSEQLLGMVWDEDEDSSEDEVEVCCYQPNCTNTTASTQSAAMSRREWDVVQFVHTILANGEYQRAAHYMRSFLFQAAQRRRRRQQKEHQQGQGQGPSSLPNPTNSSSSSCSSVSTVSHFLYLYALYMAGEKLKDQQQAEEAAVKSASSAGPGAAGSAQQAATAAAAGNPSTTSAGAKRRASDHRSPRNPCLAEIHAELHSKYMQTFGQSEAGAGAEAEHDAAGAATHQPPSMDSFLLFLYGVVVRDLSRQGGGAGMLLLSSVTNASTYSRTQDVAGGPNAAATVKISSSAYCLLLQSVALYPFNWSAWLELSEICIVEKLPLPFTEDTLAALVQEQGQGQGSRDRTGSGNAEMDQDGASLPQRRGEDASDPVRFILGKYLTAGHAQAFITMGYCFLVHTYLELHTAEAALQILQHHLLPTFPHSQIVQSQVACAYYTIRDYYLAQRCFEVCRERDPYRMDCIDTYSNILYVKDCRSELSYLAHSVTKVNKFSPQTCCVVGNFYSLKGQHEKAILYFRRAIKIDHQYLSAWTLMGHEFVELKNTSAAVYCYRRAIDISGASDYRAWYGLGQTYEMLHLYQYAFYYFKKAAALRPTDSRMWCAIGSCLYHMSNSSASQGGGGGARGGHSKRGSGSGGGASSAASAAHHIYKHEVVQVYLKALQCGDNEGIAVKELPKLYKEMGLVEKAVEIYETYYLAGIVAHNAQQQGGLGAGKGPMPPQPPPAAGAVPLTRTLSGSSLKVMSRQGSGSVGINVCAIGGSSTMPLPMPPSSASPRASSPRSTPTGHFPMYDMHMHMHMHLHQPHANTGVHAQQQQQLHPGGSSGVVNSTVLSSSSPFQPSNPATPWRSMSGTSSSAGGSGGGGLFTAPSSASMSSSAIRSPMGMSSGMNGDDDEDASLSALQRDTGSLISSGGRGGDGSGSAGKASFSATPASADRSTTSTTSSGGDGNGNGMNLSLCMHPPAVLTSDAALSAKEKSEALIFVAGYYTSVGNWRRAEMYCMYLLDQQGAEGNEARSLLREVRMMMEKSAGSAGGGAGGVRK